MADVTYECNRCGNYENPMNHRNPASGWCTGTFVWVGSRVQCQRCDGSYSTNERFWCSRCKEWHTDYTCR